MQPWSGRSPEHQVLCTRHTWGLWCSTVGHGGSFPLFHSEERLVISLLLIRNVRYLSCYFGETSLYLWNFYLLINKKTASDYARVNNKKQYITVAARIELLRKDGICAEEGHISTRRLLRRGSGTTWSEWWMALLLISLDWVMGDHGQKHAFRKCYKIWRRGCGNNTMLWGLLEAEAQGTWLTKQSIEPDTSDLHSLRMPACPGPQSTTLPMCWAWATTSSLKPETWVILAQAFQYGMGIWTHLFGELLCEDMPTSDIKYDGRILTRQLPLLA